MITIAVLATPYRLMLASDYPDRPDTGRWLVGPANGTLHPAEFVPIGAVVLSEDHLMRRHNRVPSHQLHRSLRFAADYHNREYREGYNRRQQRLANKLPGFTKLFGPRRPLP
jgi:hypothetical protein